MVYLGNLLQPMLCIFPRNQTKQCNPFNHSKSKPLGKINHSKPKIFSRNQTQQTHTQTQQTQRITIPLFRHLKNHSKLKESPFLR